MKDYKFNINGKDYAVTVNGIQDGKASVTVNGTEYSVACSEAPSGTASVGRTVKPSQKQHVTSPAANSAQASQVTRAISGGKVIEAPLPGVIIGLSVTPGQTVKRGQKVAVLEAMKMENDILAPIDGTIQEVSVQRGDSVLEGSKIATIA